MTEETELHRLQPPGELYSVWTPVNPLTTVTGVLGQAGALEEDSLRQAVVCLKVAPFYNWLVPPAAVALQDQLDSGHVAFGPSLLSVEQTAELFGTDPETVCEAMHSMHAAGWIVMNDEGEIVPRVPWAMLRPVTGCPDNPPQEG